MKTWLAKGTAGQETHGQSAVYEESDGHDIALVYDGKAHARLIAAAPRMESLLQSIARFTDVDFGEATDDQLEDALTTIKSLKRAANEILDELAP